MSLGEWVSLVAVIGMVLLLVVVLAQSCRNIGGGPTGGGGANDPGTGTGQNES